jgi:hypothetical protein
MGPEYPVCSWPASESEDSVTDGPAASNHMNCRVA